MSGQTKYWLLQKSSHTSTSCSEGSFTDWNSTVLIMLRYSGSSCYFGLNPAILLSQEFGNSCVNTLVFMLSWRRQLFTQKPVAEGVPSLRAEITVESNKLSASSVYFSLLQNSLICLGLGFWFLLVAGLVFFFFFRDRGIKEYHYRRITKRQGCCFSKWWEH